LRDVVVRTEHLIVGDHSDALRHPQRNFPTTHFNVLIAVEVISSTDDLRDVDGVP